MKNYKLTALYIIQSKNNYHNKSQRFHNTDEYYVYVCNNSQIFF